MTGAMVAGYLIAGLWAAWLLWRWPADGFEIDCYFLLVVAAAFWPVMLLIWLVYHADELDWSLPSHEEWVERRRAAQERRDEPGEVTPA